MSLSDSVLVTAHQLTATIRIVLNHYKSHPEELCQKHHKYRYEVEIAIIAISSIFQELLCFYSEHLHFQISSASSLKTFQHCFLILRACQKAHLVETSGPTGNIFLEGVIVWKSCFSCKYSLPSYSWIADHTSHSWHRRGGQTPAPCTSSRWRWQWPCQCQPTFYGSPWQTSSFALFIPTTESARQ